MSALLTMSSLKVKKPCIKVVQRGSDKDRHERGFKEMPVPVRETRSAKGILRVDSQQDIIVLGKILGCLKVELDLISVIFDVPGYLTMFHNRRCCAMFPCVLTSEPEKVSFLYAPVPTIQWQCNLQKS
jgi:hypothetical protein